MTRTPGLCRRDARAEDERGQVTVMVIGFFIVTGLLVAMVVDASAVYLGHRRLADLADGAALAASAAADRDSLYEADGVVALEVDAAERAVADYLTSTKAMARHRGLRWDVDQAGDALRVRLRSDVQLPFAPPGWDSTSEAEAEATVELRVG